MYSNLRNNKEPLKMYLENAHKQKPHAEFFERSTVYFSETKEHQMRAVFQMTCTFLHVHLTVE